MPPTTSAARLRSARLSAHLLQGTSAAAPGPGAATADAADGIAAVVEHYGAIQAQDLGAAKWVLGSRVAGSVEADVDRAFETRAIVRSWPFRGTLHVITPALLRPVLAITAPRLARAFATRRTQLGLDDRIVREARGVLERELAGRAMRRDDVLQAWQAEGIDTDGQRGYHLLAWLAVDGVVCHGPIGSGEASGGSDAGGPGGGQRFVLLDEWVPAPQGGGPDRDATLATLVTTYFRGHGPATEKDAAFWTGLPLGDIRRGLAAAGDAVVGYDRTHFVTSDASAADPDAALPRPGGRRALAAFDEYFIGYADRSPVCDPVHAPKVVPGGNGVFKPLLVDSGRIIGTWRRTDAKRGASVVLEPFEGDLDAARFRTAFDAWARFRGIPIADVSVGQRGG